MSLIMIRRHQSGFSMLEVLVSMIIIAIGLLGLAALQAQSLRSNQSAYLRSQATLLAYDMFDRMRANRVAARDGQYNVSLGEVPTGTNMVATNISEWKGNLAALLPSGDGSINRQSGERTLITITVTWNDDRETDSSGNETKQSFVFESEL